MMLKVWRKSIGEDWKKLRAGKQLRRFIVAYFRSVLILILEVVVPAGGLLGRGELELVGIFPLF